MTKFEMNTICFAGAFIGTLVVCTWLSLTMGNLLAGLFS